MPKSSDCLDFFSTWRLPSILPSSAYSFTWKGLQDTLHCYFSFIKFKNCHFQSAIKDLYHTCDLTNLWRSDTSLLASGATAKTVKWASSNMQIQSMIFIKQKQTNKNIRKMQTKYNCTKLFGYRPEKNLGSVELGFVCGHRENIWDKWKVDTVKRPKK